MLLLGVLLILGAAVWWGPIASFSGFLILLGCILVSQFRMFRCPSCRANLSQLFVSRGPINFGPRVRYCPYCGDSLDEETATKDNVAAGENW